MMATQKPRTKEQRRARRVVQQKERGRVPDKWVGSICFGTDRDAIWLRIVGVKLGPEKPGGWHDCEMTHSVFKKVEKHWGAFFWTLEPVYPAMPKEKAR